MEPDNNRDPAATHDPKTGVLHPFGVVGGVVGGVPFDGCDCKNCSDALVAGELERVADSSRQWGDLEKTRLDPGPWVDPESRGQTPYTGYVKALGKALIKLVPMVYDEGRCLHCAAPELRPPPEHEGKPCHFAERVSFLDAAERYQEVFGWVGGQWLIAGDETPYSPKQMADAGWRYLGPAEWQPLDQAMGVLYGARRKIEIERDEANVRIATLEAELAHWRVAAKTDAITPGLWSDATVAADKARIAALEHQVERCADLLRARSNDRAVMFHMGCAVREDILDEIITEPELRALGWVYDPHEDAWHRTPPATIAEDRAHDHVGPADDVHRRANDVMGDLINGRIGLPTRRALRDAVDKADKIPEPKSFPGRALRIEAMTIGVRLP